MNSLTLAGIAALVVTAGALVLALRARNGPVRSRDARRHSRAWAMPFRAR